MKNSREKAGILVCYQVDRVKSAVAKCYRTDIDETIKSIETMRDLDCDVCFRNEDDLEDFIFEATEEDRAYIIDKVYGIEDYTVYLGTKASLFCVEVYLKEKY